MTAWSTIADRTAGQTITASWANTLRDNALHLYELVGATGTAFTSSAPTWGGAGLTVGNGTASGGYFTLGKLAIFRSRFVLGSTSTVNGVVTTTIPGGLTMATATAPGVLWCVFYDSSATKYYAATAVAASTTTIQVYQHNTSSLNDRLDNPATGSPFTWATSDEIQVTGIVELA